MEDVRCRDDLTSLPPIAQVADCTSKVFQRRDPKDLYEYPPDCEKNGVDYDATVDSFRFGMLCHEVWMQAPWNWFGGNDQELVLRRQKPIASGADILNRWIKRWVGLEENQGPPILLMDLAQMALLNPASRKRPSPTVVVQTLRWLLEDDLIAQGILPPRAPGAPSSRNSEQVLAQFGYQCPPPLSVPKNLFVYRVPKEYD